MTKFIKIHEKIYNINLLTNAYRHGNQYFFNIDNTCARVKYNSMMEGAFHSFIENLDSDDLCFGSCFDVDREIQNGEKTEKEFLEMKEKGGDWKDCERCVNTAEIKTVANWLSRCCVNEDMEDRIDHEFFGGWGEDKVCRTCALEIVTEWNAFLISKSQTPIVFFREKVEKNERLEAKQKENK